MKKYILLIMILFSCVILSGCIKKEPEYNDLDKIIKRGYLIVGVKEDAPPFGYYKKGSLQGVDIDIAKEIANNIFQSESSKNIEFVKVNPQNRISKLNSKEVDILVATMSVNAKRKLIIDFSIPYFTTSQKLMIRENSKISHINYFNTAGRLGVVLGTTGERIIHQIAPTARITGTRSYKEATLLLLSGQIDGIIGDDCILKSYVTKGLKIVNRAYSKEYYAVAVRKSEKSKELLDEVNASISSMMDDKKLNNIKKTYIRD